MILVAIRSILTSLFSNILFDLKHRHTLIIILMAGLLGACSSQAMSVFKPDNQRWMSVGFANATGDLIFDVGAQVCNHYVKGTRIPGYHMKPSGGGGGTGGVSYCNKPITVYWTNAYGENKVYKASLDQRSYPEAEDDKKYHLIITIKDEMAIAEPRVRSRELSKELRAIGKERREKFIAKQIARLRPYIDKAKNNYSDWESAEIYVNGYKKFDYRMGNKLVRYYFYDSSINLMLDASDHDVKGTPGILKPLDFSESFRFEDFNEAIKEFNVIVDMRVMPGQKEHVLRNSAVLLERAKRYGFEVKITEVVL